MAVGDVLKAILLIVVILFIVGAIGTFGPVWSASGGPYPVGPASP